MRIDAPKTYWVYMLASKPRGVLYVGMTSELAKRGWQHRERVMTGFAKRYWVQRLVYFEAHADAQVAARLEDRAHREAQSDVARSVRRRGAWRWVRVVSGAVE
jgi:predicted GIY-YIG superfamily endonuclease